MPTKCFVLSPRHTIAVYTSKFNKPAHRQNSSPCVCYRSRLLVKLWLADPLIRTHTMYTYIALLAPHKCDARIYICERDLCSTNKRRANLNSLFANAIHTHIHRMVSLSLSILMIVCMHASRLQIKAFHEVHTHTYIGRHVIWIVCVSWYMKHMCLCVYMYGKNHAPDWTWLIRSVERASLKYRIRVRAMFAVSWARIYTSNVYMYMWRDEKCLLRRGKIDWDRQNERKRGEKKICSIYSNERGCDKFDDEFHKFIWMYVLVLCENEIIKFSTWNFIGKPHSQLLFGIYQLLLWYIRTTRSLCIRVSRLASYRSLIITYRVMFPREHAATRDCYLWL